MRYCHFSWHHLEVFQLLMLLPVMPDKFSRHVGQFPTSCSDPLTSEQGLASDIVICLQLGHPEFMHYQETSYLEKEKLYGRRRRAGVIRAGRRGVRGTDTPHYLGQQPKKSFLLPDAGSRSRSSLSALEYRDKIELEAKMKITTINALKTFTANQSVQGGRDEEESQSDIQEWLSLTQRAFWCWGLPVEGCFTWGSKRAGLSNLWGFFHLTDKALCCWYCMDIHTPGCCVHFTHWKRIQAQSLSHVTQPFCLLFGRAEFPSSHTLRLLQGMITVVVSRSKGNSWGWGGVGSGQGRHLKREAIISSLVSAFLPVMKTGPTDLMWFCVPWVLKD